MIEAELKAYSPALAAKPRWIVISKCDVADEELRDEIAARFKEMLLKNDDQEENPTPLTVLSSASFEGIKDFIDNLGDRVRAERALQAAAAEKSLDDAPTKAGKNPVVKDADDQDDDDFDDGEVECVWVP